jgi:hypothetical protein
MREVSRRGIEVLRVLALAIRSEQDYGIIATMQTAVGAIRDKVAEDEAINLTQNYRPPYSALPDFAPLPLRQPLNKIAHADPRSSGYFADSQTHDLILVGQSLPEIKAH